MKTQEDEKTMILKATQEDETLPLTRQVGNKILSKEIANLARTSVVQSSEDERIKEIGSNDGINKTLRSSNPSLKFIKPPQATFQ
jgi:hypothetical protein